MSEHYQICKRCIMDTSDPDIVFDESGLCNHCKRYFEKEKRSCTSTMPDSSGWRSW
jgi:hypothetical protein